jgi:hypothetical protein
LSWQDPREIVLDRDDNQCRFCDASSDLEVHHILPRRYEGPDHPENLVTVCQSCHGELEQLTNTIFGALDDTRDGLQFDPDRVFKQRDGYLPGDFDGDVPYIYERTSITEGRDRVPLFLQPETKRAEREFKTSAEGIVNENISLTDLREAAYLVAMEHEVEVVAQLRGWGYDFE